MNVAGFLGYAPDKRQPVDWSALGAFVTNPVSLEARTPARGVRCQTFPGGFLLHTGHPNPGLRAVQRRYAGRWAASPIPVIVHLLASEAEQVQRLVSLLESVDGVAALELGLPPGIQEAGAKALVEASRGERPVIVRCPIESAHSLAPVLAKSGAAMLSLSAPRGALPAPNGSNLQGRLYGQALYPQTLAVVQSLAHTGLPVLGAGGIYSRKDIQVMLEAGAIAVQLDGVLWRGGVLD